MVDGVWSDSVLPGKRGRERSGTSRGGVESGGRHESEWVRRVGCGVGSESGARRGDQRPVDVATGPTRRPCDPVVDAPAAVGVQDLAVAPVGRRDLLGADGRAVHTGHDPEAAAPDVSTRRATLHPVLGTLPRASRDLILSPVGTGPGRGTVVVRVTRYTGSRTLVGEARK